MASVFPTGIPVATVPVLGPALPEIILACAGLLLLMVGALRSMDAMKIVTAFALVALAVAAGVLFQQADGNTAVTFGTTFIVDPFAVILKGTLIIGTFMALLMSAPYWCRANMQKPEYPVLMLLATVGMGCMVSANDLLVLYIGLELQSFALYILASFQRDKQTNSEAGLKYFFLGALSSGILLYGMSLIYGYAGTTQYLTLGQSFSSAQALQPGLIVGMVMVLSGMAFKVAAAPFHMWTPDVYQGAPTPVTAFFAIAPKVAAFAMLMRLLFGPFAGLVDQWQQVVLAMAVLSVVVGAFAGLRQTSLKRLLAYSSIGHAGFVLLGLASGTVTGLHMAVLYIIIYVIMSVGAFAVVLSLFNGTDWVDDINGLAGLAKLRPIRAFAFAVIMFSMAGLPPLAGFFAKLYVLKAAVEADLFVMATIAVVASVVSAYYYLRIVKVMYFDEPQHSFECAPMYTAIAVVSAVALIILTIMPSWIYNLADLAVLKLS